MLIDIDIVWRQLEWTSFLVYEVKKYVNESIFSNKPMYV